MGFPRTWGIPVSLAIVCCVGLACAESTRYRVLSFFFEGVPKPGEALAAAGDTDGEHAAVTDGEGQPADEEGVVATGPVARLHPPYQQFRCGVCHNPNAGGVMKSPQEGLCRACHEIPGDLRFAHGPVSVSDCLFCHHHHGGEHIYMLRTDPKDLCFRCHDADDLTEGQHHATLEENLCMDCHHAHGGDNRFFLKPETP